MKATTVNATSIAGLLDALLALPAVKLLWEGSPYTDAQDVLQHAVSKGLRESLDIWYNARSFRHLAENPDLGYPGDLPVFQLSLKAGFLPYRYAFPATQINQALEAIQAALPSPAEIDGYSDNPATAGMERRRLASESVKRGRGEPTPGCDCPACQSRRSGTATPEEPSDEDIREVTSSLAAQLRRLLGGQSGVEVVDLGGEVTQRHNPGREMLTVLAEQLRERVQAGDERRILSWATSAPGLGTLQATLGEFQKLGFGDLVDRVVSVYRRDADQGFKLVPSPGDLSYDEYTNVSAGFAAAA